MYLKFKLLLISIFIFSQLLTAQNFVEGAYRFSSKKIAIINLANGTTVKGYIDDIDRKKGLIEEIVIKDSITKKKVTYKPEQIKDMYIPPSGYDKLVTAHSVIHNAQKWTNDTINSTYIKEGYAYFENADVMIKKKKMTLLVQLVNPGFANKIRVYLDPNAAETTSYGIGGITLAGGDAKSYYVKKGKDVAFKLTKKEYDEEFKNLYGDCPAFYNEASKKIYWSDLEKHIYNYSLNCQ